MWQVSSPALSAGRGRRHAVRPIDASAPGGMGGSAVAETLRVTPNCRIPLDELEWRFSTSGGPGGQHANNAQTRVEVRFDVTGSPSLGGWLQQSVAGQPGPPPVPTAPEPRTPEP